MELQEVLEACDSTIRYNKALVEILRKDIEALKKEVELLTKENRELRKRWQDEQKTNA